MIKIKDFAFNPLKGGAFSITATITPEMIEEYGGKMAAMQKMLPLLGTEFVTVSVNETPADAMPQDETYARILEMLGGIKAYIDTKSQVEMALCTDEGDAGGKHGVCYNEDCDFHSSVNGCSDNPPYSCPLIKTEPFGTAFDG